MIDEIIDLYIQLSSLDSVNKNLFSGIDVNIALIDSGIDAFHPLLIESINKKGSNSFSKDSDPLIDNLGHGTEVTGIIKQISPWSTFTPYKIVDHGNANSLDIIAAIKKAIDNKVDIINLSLGTYKNLKDNSDLEIIKLYKEVITHASDKGILIVSSLGNKNFNLDYQLKNKNLVHLPSLFENVISVGALNKSGKLSSFTNYYEFKDFFTSLGGDLVFENVNKLNLSEMIYTTSSRTTSLPTPISKSGYTMTAGCSISAAIVTGIVANLLFLYKKHTVIYPSIKDIKNILKSISKGQCEYFNDHKICYSNIEIPEYSQNFLYYL